MMGSRPLNNARRRSQPGGQQLHREYIFDTIENQLIATLFEEISDRRAKPDIHRGRRIRWQDELPRPPPRNHGVAGRGRHQVKHHARLAHSGKRIETFPQIKAVNCARSPIKKVLPFYWVRKQQPQSWEGIVGSSLDKETILRQRNPSPPMSKNLLSRQKCLSAHAGSRLPGTRPQERRSGEGRCREGRDDQVICSIDFNRIRPTLMLYEHRLISQERNLPSTAKKADVARLQAPACGAIQSM